MSAFTDSLRLGVARLASRRLFVLAMAVVPLLTTVFFVSLMHSGLPLRTPVGIVDKDLSPSSRKVTRMLNAEELLDIRYHYDSFEEAMAAVRTGESFGFFLIPGTFGGPCRRRSKASRRVPCSPPAVWRRPSSWPWA